MWVSFGVRCLAPLEFCSTSDTVLLSLHVLSGTRMHNRNVHVLLGRLCHCRSAECSCDVMWPRGASEVTQCLSLSYQGPSGSIRRQTPGVALVGPSSLDYPCSQSLVAVLNDMSGIGNPCVHLGRGFTRTVLGIWVDRFHVPHIRTVARTVAGTADCNLT